MRTFRFPKLVPFLAAGVLTFGVACGDDDDDDDVPPTIDASVGADAPAPDAGVPDAGGPDAAVSTRSGTVAVTDITLVDSAAVEANWFSGAAVTVSYVPVPPVKAPDFSNIVPPGVGCTATNFDFAGGDLPPVQQDEGTITLGGAGLLSPIGPCNLVGDSYRCLFGGGALAAGDTFTLNGDNQTANVSIAAATFDAATDSEVGMFLSTSGFTDPTAGAGDVDPYNGVFPIVAVQSATVVTVAFPTEAVLPAGTIVTPGTFAVASGAGPTPASVPFLDAEASITIEKSAGNETEAIDPVTVTVGGGGYRMDDATLGLMRAMPIDSATALSYSCTGAGGSCSAGDGAGTVVSITATNADLTDAGDFELPPGANVVSVSCRAFGDTVMVPTEVLDILEGISPTRIQTTMFRADFALDGDADGTNQTGMVAGKGYTAFGVDGSAD